MESNEKEILYNGIRLPEEWPPRNLCDTTLSPISVPYLENPPTVIYIDKGRQLFVDDFLIENTNLKRDFHNPRLYEHNPVLKPETQLEINNGKYPVASPFNDGVFYDAEDQLFKMWYHAGWFDGVGYAISEDGLHWYRPMLDVAPATNRVLPVREGYRRDGVAVWLDQQTDDPNQRFKMFAYFRSPDWSGGEVYASFDGIHWGKPVRTGPCGDNTTFFYNAFRKKWVYSIRTSNRTLGRTRSYREHEDFIKGASWKKEDVVFWARADELDEADPDLGYAPQLYDVNAVAYESLLLGLFAIFKGPPNELCAIGGFPKTNELVLGYSRDGFHWHRPVRSPFIAGSRKEGRWNRGYIHAAGGGCLVVDDKIYFYFGAWSGESPTLGRHMYAGGTTGLAILRRDGFASMNAGLSTESLTTKPVIFNKGRHLFVNTNTKNGMLQVEILDNQGNVIEPYSHINCVPITKNTTRQLVRWKEGEDLSSLAGKSVKFRFYLTNGQLYSFWVSPDLTGASGGYVAAGGPGFSTTIDTVGSSVGQRSPQP